MIGKFWSTGIVLKCHSHKDNEWSAKAPFYDEGFCCDRSTEGEVRSRYIGPLKTVLDIVKADVEALGISWHDPMLFAWCDGEDEDYPMPDDWRDILNEHATRIGFRSY